MSKPLTFETLQTGMDKMQNEAKDAGPLFAKPTHVVWTSADIARIQGISEGEVTVYHYALEFCVVRCAHDWETCSHFPPKGTRGDQVWCDEFRPDTRVCK